VANMDMTENPTKRTVMRGISRSFWVLVAALAAIEGLLVYLAVQSLAHILPCWWAVLPNPGPEHLDCGESVAIFGFSSWVPGAVIMGFLMVTLFIGMGTLCSQITRTRRALNRLPSPMDKPQRLLDIETPLGMDVSLVPDERWFCCCAGYLAPRVILSTAMFNGLESDQVAAVLAHELAHAKRRDPVRALAVRVAANSLFYFPMARRLARQSLVASEIGADNWAANAVGRPALVGALVSVLGQVRPALGGVSEMSSLDALDVRIEALRTNSLPRFRPSVLAVGVSVVALAGLWGLWSWLPPHITRVIVSHVEVTPAGRARISTTTTSTGQ
jgi:Zn-dependent protease with chaperone function